MRKGSHCKINLVLNVLGKREDGFHELETLLYPVPFHDYLEFELEGNGIRLTCSDPAIPVDESNLIWKAAKAFFDRIGKPEQGIRIHLEKRIPCEAGLGGGSGNAAVTLRAVNELLGSPLEWHDLVPLAAMLGSDIPFFLEETPALATGRGEQIKRLAPFDSLNGFTLLLVRPEFGIKTGWAYRQLQYFPEALHGRNGRAHQVAEAISDGNLDSAFANMSNAFEYPAFKKYPLLEILKQRLLGQGARAALISGSGSATFAFVDTAVMAEKLAQEVKEEFGAATWVQVVTL